ncbi:hypothetical protein MKX03_029466, partial [Papaver bracteatum]
MTPSYYEKQEYLSKFTKKGDPEVMANKASKAIKAGALTIKKKSKKIRTSITFHRPKTLYKERNPKYPCINPEIPTHHRVRNIEDNNKKKIKDVVKMYNIQTEKVNTLI